MGYEGSSEGFSLARLLTQRKADRRGRAERGASGPDATDISDGGVQPSPALREGWALQARRELLDQITRFLLSHGLDVTPQNLHIAHAAMSGSDLSLARQIGARQVSGKQITQEWLDQVSSAPKNIEKQREHIDQMMAKLEQSIAGFATTTQSARSATADYRGQFSEHLERAEGTGNNRDFLTISRAMLETLQRIETSMNHSHSETERLQVQLRKARSEADSDHLTGLPNRRAFERELYNAHIQALDTGTPLYLAIADIDHFKRVNDTFGHETGDRLLRAIAQILRQYASQDCFVARHGGEEFVMLLHTQTLEEAQQRMEAARHEVESRKFVTRLQNQAIGKVTFSAGVADVMASSNPRNALAAADDALYEAKQAGRNRVMIATNPGAAD